MEIQGILIGAFAGGIVTIITTFILKKRARYVIERSDEDFKQGFNLPVGANLRILQGDREIENFRITSFVITNDSTTDFENVKIRIWSGPDRFILHDTAAREVDDFYTYYNSRVAGGTQISSAYHLVNEIVDKENLIQDYNIYVFQGTDGDDWDTEGKEAIPELKNILSYASRVGVTVIKHSYGSGQATEVEKYLQKSGLLKEKANLLRIDVMREDADESRLIEGIKKLISHKVESIQ